MYEGRHSGCIGNAINRPSYALLIKGDKNETINEIPNIFKGYKPIRQIIPSHQSEFTPDLLRQMLSLTESHGNPQSKQRSEPPKYHKVPSAPPLSLSDSEEIRGNTNLNSVLYVPAAQIHEMYCQSIEFGEFLL